LAICQNLNLDKLQKIFDQLIDSFIENKIGIATDFLSENLAYQLTQNLLHHFNHHEMKAAGTGNEQIALQNKNFRSDKIFWLDKNNNNPFEDDFFKLMDAFILYLNSTCFTSITSYEFHYTMYEKGDFYKKHLDQFKNNDSRKFSFITYLNQNWTAADGGELLIHHQHAQQHISPQNGKSVFFKSNELPHEVLVTNKSRMSITGWLKSD
jgi:SM-20-related protein